MIQAADNYSNIRQEIDRCAKKHGRDPKEILLLAISKTHPWGRIEPVYGAGCRAFGESKMQEALPKIAEAPQDISWHWIGTLQKNKVRKAIGVFALIHSVEDLALAQKISECSKEKGVETHVLLEVNTSGEATKHGLKEEEWQEVFQEVVALPNLVVEGLMTLGPHVSDSEVIRASFRSLRMLKEALNGLLPKEKQMHHLSMGMSGDYLIAVEEGATIVRVGAGIFGMRR